MKAIARCFLAALFALGSARAATYTVTSNADDGEGSLRALCAAAAKGDTIVIPAGMVITLDSQIKTIDKATYFIGDPDNRPVITTSGSGFRAIEFGRSAAPYEFRNIVFRNIDAGASLTGGGLYLNDYTGQGVIVSNCLFDACSAKQGAALHFARQDGPHILQDCEFRDCTDTEGYVCLMAGKGRMERCLFTGNTSPASAPCALVNSGWWDAMDCVFTNNVGKQGGAIQIGNTPSNVFTRCTFVDNDATEAGGAIYSRNHYTLRDCVFRRNHAVDGGGAIFRYNGRIEYYNCLFEENGADGKTNWQGGAAVFSRDDGTSGGIVSNCVFRNNANIVGNGVGGAFYGYGSRSPTEFTDCLFEGNRALDNSGVLKLTSAATLRTCTFSSNYCSKGVSAVWIGTGDLSEIPPESPDVTEERPVLLENCTFFGNTTDTGRGCIWIDNARNVTLYHDADGAVIGNLNNYIRDNPGSPVTTNKYDALDHVSLRHCTIVDNTGGSYGALYVNNSSVTTSRVTVAATVFHGNTYNGAAKDINGAVRTLNYTVTDQANAWTIREPENSANNWFGGALGDPKFDGALAANGTEKTFLDGTHLPTLAIAASSPLRNKAPVTVATDARGVARGSVSNLAALGAYEYEPFVPTTVLIR